MRITDSTMSGVSAKTRLRFGMPALLTRTSTPPSSSDALRRERPRARRGRRGRSSTHATRACAAGSAFEHFVETVGAPCADADGRAALREALGQRGADPRRRSGHQHVLAVQVVRSWSRTLVVRAAHARSRPTPVLLTGSARLLVVTGAAAGHRRRRRDRAAHGSVPTSRSATATSTDSLGPRPRSSAAGRTRAPASARRA